MMHFSAAAVDMSAGVFWQAICLRSSWRKRARRRFAPCRLAVRLRLAHLRFTQMLQTTKWAPHFIKAMCVS
jgi:hypothetical protein